MDNSKTYEKRFLVFYSPVVIESFYEEIEEDLHIYMQDLMDRVPMASGLDEVFNRDNFYDYEDKYLNACADVLRSRIEKFNRHSKKSRTELAFLRFNFGMRVSVEPGKLEYYNPEYPYLHNLINPMLQETGNLFGMNLYIFNILVLLKDVPIKEWQIDF